MIDSRGLIALLRKCLKSYTPKVERVAQIEWDTEDGATPPPLPYALVVPQSSRYVYAGERVKFRKWLNPLGHGVNETIYELTVIGI